MQAVDIKVGAHQPDSATADVGHRTPISNGMLAIWLLLTTEVMFFAALVSAYLVSRANAMVWPPPLQPRLPVAHTAINSLFLLASALTMRNAVRSEESHGSAVGGTWVSEFRGVRGWLALTTGLGALFVALQGVEWVRLLRFGLSGRLSTYGGFFYLIVGAHATHVVFGLVALLFAFAGWLKRGSLPVAGIYWYFVVGLWPVLYTLVYLT